MAGSINRRDFLRWTAAGSAALALPNWLSAGDAPPAGARRPNIVLIMADDLGYECLGADGCLDYKTPVLDGLAGGGVRFTNCHSQPLCTPSRVQIMTGRYNSRNYVRFGAMDFRERTFAHVLRDAGYATCIVGKWQLDYAGPKEKRIETVKLPDAAGFDEHCLWQLRKRDSRYWDPLIEQNGQWLENTKGKYGPDIFTDYAIDFVTRKKEQPFLLYWPMCLTHDPFVHSPDAKADAAAKGGKGAFKSMVEYMDKLVGKLVAHLDKLGLRENTLILFTGDNGTGRGVVTRTKGGVVRGAKGDTIDTGTHVPLIASWKGRDAAGRVCEDLVDFSDFLPTVVAAAGATGPKGVELDGRSFLPQVLGKPGKPGEPREWIYCYYTDKAGKFQSRHVRDRRYKLYGNGRLHDVQAHPLERKPIEPADDTPESAAARQRLQKAMDELAATETRPVNRDSLSRWAPQPSD